MNIFEFSDYRTFIQAEIQALPHGGRGELQKISKELNMHATRLSHVLRGQENFTLEQACALGEYLDLNETQTEYLVVLVQLERAGTPNLRKMTKRQLDLLRSKSLELRTRLTVDRDFNEPEKAVFYSNWYYSGVRLASSLRDVNTPELIAKRLKLPRKIVREALDFLVSCKLCLQEGEKFRMGPVRTHLDGSSPLISRLHTNWRLKAIEHFPNIRSEELSFTAPMSIPVKDVLAIREILVQAIEKVARTANNPDPETLMCLNIDWFEF